MELEPRTVQDIDTELLRLNEERVRIAVGLPSETIDAAAYASDSAGWTPEQRRQQRLIEIGVREYQLASERALLCLAD